MTNASFSAGMPILLHLDASPRGDRSITRRLTHDFALAWKQAHPRGQIIYRGQRRFRGRGWYCRNRARQR